jgi:hypothetical protein
MYKAEALLSHAKQAQRSVGIFVPTPDPGAGTGADGRHHGLATLLLGKRPSAHCTGG